MILVLPYKFPGLYDGDDTIFSLSVYDSCLVGGFQRFVPKYYLNLQGKRGGRVSVFGIATRYGLDGPGIESRWG
jgi:hypothetical protein